MKVKRLFFRWSEIQRNPHGSGIDVKKRHQFCLCICFDSDRICGYLPCALFLGSFYQSTADPEDRSACWNHDLTTSFDSPLGNLKPRQVGCGTVHQRMDHQERSTYWIMRVGSMARQEQWLTALDLRVHSNGSLIAQTDIGQSAFNSQCLCSIRHLILDMKSIVQPSTATTNHKESNTWNSWDAMRLTSMKTMII